jgi:hypothetical protein
LEHYVYRNSPPGWCCQALPTNPGRPRPAFSILGSST